MAASRDNRLSSKLTPEQVLARLAARCSALKRTVEETDLRRGPEIDYTVMGISSECRMFKAVAISSELAIEFLPKVRALRLSLPALESAAGTDAYRALDALIKDLEAKCPASPSEPEKGSGQ